MSFAVQALSAMYIKDHHEKLGNQVIDVSGEIDDLVAREKAGSLGIEIDQLTEEQAAYLSSWNV